MNLFIINNFFSILSAEKIIKQEKLTNNIAFLSGTNKEYLEKLSKNINKNFFKNIYRGEIGCLVPKKDKEKSLFKKIKKVFLYPRKMKKLINRKRTRTRDFFEKNNISAAYFPILEGTKMKIMFNVAKKMNIETNLYEEGISLYLDWDKPFLEKIKLKVADLLIQKDLISKRTKNFKVDNVYCFFPEKYTFNNSTTIKKLKFSLDSEQSQKLQKLRIENLFLSRPLSEDGLLSLGAEIKIVNQFFSKNDFNKVYFKFHPRESREKIKILKDKFNIFSLPKEFQNLAAEEIIWFGKIKNVIGYETSTLAYMSEFKKGVNFYSLLEKILQKNKSSYFRASHYLYRNKFKKIKFL
jgi:hypothetical protein